MQSTEMETYENMFRIYLAGPMTGMDECSSKSWRREVAKRIDKIAPGRICCSTPGRNFERLINAGHYNPSVVELPCFVSDRGIMSRDYHDCTTSGVVIFNLRGAKTPSIGTMMELAWCYQKKIPTIVIMEPEGNVHDHPMVREAIDFRVVTIEDAVDAAISVLCPKG